MTLQNVAESGYATTSSHGFEMFTLTSGNVTIRVESSVAGLRGWVSRLLGPIFAEATGKAPGVPVVTVTALPLRDLPDVPPRSPVLIIDETRTYVLEHNPECIAVVREEGEHPPLLISTVPGSDVVAIALVTDGPRIRDDEAWNLRSVIRFLKFMVGARIHAAGGIFLHGAAIARDDDALLLLGRSGSGKSSLSFLAADRAGWGFLSDDLVYLSPGSMAAGPPLRVRGWPHRVGLSISALSGYPDVRRFEETPLRRHGGPYGSVTSAAARAWGVGTRRRLYLDLDEFQELTGATVIPDARLTGVVLPQPEEHRTGWEIEALPTGPAGWSRRYQATLHEVKYITDFLGMQVPSRTGVRRDGPGLAALERLPRVRVRYGRDANARMPALLDEIGQTLRAAGGRS